MRSFRVLALAVLALMFTIVLAACGGGGSTPPPPPTPLTVVTSFMPLATVNIPYNFIFQANGGSGSYNWTIKSGSLPPGLKLNSSLGAISGTPTTYGVYNFTPQVTDGAGAIASKSETLTVEGVILISCGQCTGTSLPYGNPGVPYSVTLSASGGKAPFTWCVTETDGSCGNGSQGGLPPGLTITTDANNNGVISGTPITPGTPTPVTVQVSDSETIVSRGSRSMTLTIFDLGPKTLPNATLNTPYNQSVSALGGLGPYTWTLTGTLPPGLNFGTCVRIQRPSCAITGTPTQVGTTSFTLTVTDGETPPASATASVSITVGPLATNATLNGTYLVALNGFKSGNPYIMAGSFATDGNGHVTGGSLDYNDGSGEPNDPTQCRNNMICPIAQVVQTSSSYDLSPGNGLGTLTLNTLDNAQNPHTYHFSIAISGTGTSCVASRTFSSCGRLIETDSQMYGSGVLKVQDPAIFAIRNFFPGNFALLANGTDPGGNRYAAAGALATNPNTRVDIDCNGNGWGLPGCPFDTNDNGNGGVGTTLPDPFGGSFSADMSSTTGRGNFVSMVFANDPEGLCLGSHNGHYNCGYAYYVINYTEMLLISSDATNLSGAPHANLLLWSLFRQKSSATGWTVNSLNPVSVMELSANDGGKPDITSGLLATDQQGSGTFASDENDGGTLNQQPAAPGTIAVGTAGNDTGQYLLTGFPQFGTGGAVMYMFSGVSANGGYVVGTDSKVTSGIMDPQVAPPPGTSFSDASVNGNYTGGTATPVLTTVTNAATYLDSNGIGGIIGAQNTSGPGGVNTANLTLTYQVDSTGRGVVLDQNNNPYGFLYVISPGKFAMVPVGTTPALSILANGQPD